MSRSSVAVLEGGFLSKARFKRRCDRARLRFRHCFSHHHSCKSGFISSHAFFLRDGSYTRLISLPLRERRECSTVLRGSLTIKMMGTLRPYHRLSSRKHTFSELCSQAQRPVSEEDQVKAPSKHRSRLAKAQKPRAPLVLHEPSHRATCASVEAIKSSMTRPWTCTRLEVGNTHRTRRRG